MRKIIYFLLLTFVISHSASGASGAYYNYYRTPNTYTYLGAQLAHANSHYNKEWLLENFSFSSVDSVDNTGVAGRIYVGHYLAPYLAGEVGYSLFSNVVYNGVNGSGSHRLHFTQEAIDFLAKAVFRTKKGLCFYGKAGLAWVHRDKINDDDMLTRNPLVPAMSLGINFPVVSHVELDVSYNYYSSTRDFESTHFYAIGLAYQFY